MRRFRFRLEPLLTTRRHAERARQRAVAELELQRRRLEDTLRRRQAFIADGKRELRDRMTGVIDVAALRAHAATGIRMLVEAQRLAVELAGVYQRLAAARLELAEAARARRAMELLREQRFAAWRAECTKEEQQALDELSMRGDA